MCRTLSTNRHKEMRRLCDTIKTVADAYGNSAKNLKIKDTVFTGREAIGL